MSLLSPILRSVQDHQLAFWCPGCGHAHAITYGGNGWSWDGNVERPTFSPSILVRNGHYADGKRGEENGCWCTYNAEHPNDPSIFTCGICHSFVKDGQIQFLGDCTHALAGQTVPIPPWPHGAGGEP